MRSTRTSSRIHAFTYLRMYPCTLSRIYPSTLVPRPNVQNEPDGQRPSSRAPTRDLNNNRREPTRPHLPGTRKMQNEPNSQTQQAVQPLPIQTFTTSAPAAAEHKTNPIDTLPQPTGCRPERACPQGARRVEEPVLSEAERNLRSDYCQLCKTNPISRWATLNTHLRICTSTQAKCAKRTQFCGGQNDR